MRTAMIMAVTAFGLVGLQSPVSPTTGSLLVRATQNDALQGYEGSTAIQHRGSPEKVQPYHQASEQTGVDNGAV